MSAWGELNPGGRSGAAEALEGRPRREVLEQAAEWLALLSSGGATAEDHSRLAHWRAAHPTHENAWLRAQALLGTLEGLPPALARPSLGRTVSASRRNALKRLVLAALLAPGAVVLVREAPWQPWLAEYRSGTGELREVALRGGGLLTLDTASAANVQVEGQSCRIELVAGRVFVACPAGEAITLASAGGELRTWGASFSASLRDRATDVEVFDGRVALHPAQGVAQELAAGKAARLGAAGVEAPRDTAAAAAAAAWRQGMLVAEGMRLDVLLAELSRYRRGWLRCAPEVAALEVAGAFPLLDTDRALALLQASLPVRVRSVGPYWVQVAAA